MARPAPGIGRFFNPAYHWRIISTKRFVNPKLSMRSWLPYIIEFIFLVYFVFLYFMPLHELAAFRAGGGIVRVGEQDLRLLAGAGLYVAFGLPVRIAILRRHRMPQIAEWLCLYLGFACAALFLIFGGPLLNLYAGAEGYHHCFNDNGSAIYAEGTAACPAVSGGV